MRTGTTGERPERVSEEERREILAALGDGDEERVLSLLGEWPGLAEVRSDEGVSLLLLALYHRRPRIAEAVRERRGELDLFEAAAVGDDDRLDELLVAGTDPSAKAPDGFTALHLAGFFARPEAVAGLLAAGADPDVPADNPMRVAPLHSTVTGGDLAAVRHLLAAGAAPDSRQQGGYTPLMSAAGAGREDLVDLLLEHGANPAVAAEDGRRAADLAQERGHPELAVRLTGASELVASAKRRANPDEEEAR